MKGLGFDWLHPLWPQRPLHLSRWGSQRRCYRVTCARLCWGAVSTSMETQHTCVISPVPGNMPVRAQ